MNNEKMSQQVYIDKILNSVVLSMLEVDEDFVMKENQDGEHDSKNNNNKVRRWKTEKGLNYYINTSTSPDLSVIENAFLSLKQELSNTSHWDEETLFERANWAWEHCVSYDYINRQIESMENRMQEVLDGEGRMIGH